MKSTTNPAQVNQVKVERERLRAELARRRACAVGGLRETHSHATCIHELTPEGCPHAAGARTSSGTASSTCPLQISDLNIGFAQQAFSLGGRSTAWAIHAHALNTDQEAVRRLLRTALDLGLRTEIRPAASWLDPDALLVMVLRRTGTAPWVPG